MPWTPGRWPPEKGVPITAGVVMNETRSALAERDGLVYAGYVPGTMARWAPLRGTPDGRGETPYATVANFQRQVREMLEIAQPLQWWDAARGELYTLPHLCQDAFGAGGWTWDLTAAGGPPLNHWAPAGAVIFAELRAAANRLDRVQILPTFSESVTRDSVGRLTLGISNWAAARAATFAEFDGVDDGQISTLAYDVGMGGEVFDAGTFQEWTLESRELRMTFATGELAGYTVARAWLDFSTASPAGTADFMDTFTAEVVDGAGAQLATFGSADTGAKRVEVPAASILTGDSTTFTVRSTRSDAADRPVWTPAGPDYTSTYQEGLAVVAPVQLIVEVALEYHG
jgi:hypothetical protein